MNALKNLSDFKKRLLFFIVTILITPLGFATTFYLGPGSKWVELYAGDIFYPVFWYFLIMTIFPRLNYLLLAGFNLLFDIIIEFSQLLEIPFLENIRENFIGRTIFGSGFDKNDFMYYIFGNVISIIIYSLLRRLSLGKR